MQLPQKPALQEFLSYRQQPQLWLHVVSDICAEHNISPIKLNAFTDGANLVASVDDKYVVKIFPPFHHHQWESEYMALRQLQNKLNIPIPELIAFGKLEDEWTFVIITMLPGVTLENTWAGYTRSEKILILKHIGSIISNVHSIPVGSLSELKPDWDLFIIQQKSNCYQRHKRFEMPEWFLNDLEKFVEGSFSLLSQPQQKVILTCEYTPFNMIVNQQSDKKEISGMIDFGDTMVGDPHYDLLGPLLFLAEGDPELVRSLLEGYGYSKKEMNKQLRRKLMLLAILYRYSNFKLQIHIPDWMQKVKNIEELEELIWPL